MVGYEVINGLSGSSVFHKQWLMLLLELCIVSLTLSFLEAYGIGIGF